MRTNKRLLAVLTALLLCCSMFPLPALAAYNTASAHINSIPAPVFTYEGEYKDQGYIVTGDPFDLTLGWTTYSGAAPDDVGEIKEITLVAISDPSRYFILYRNGTAYYGAKATVSGNNAKLAGVDSADIEPGLYAVYVTTEDDRGVNTMQSMTMQSFAAPGSLSPGDPGDLGFVVEPFFFVDNDFENTTTEIPIGSEFALSVYVGDNPEDVLLIELFSDGDPFHEYMLYDNGEVFYGGKLDEYEGPGFMTGFSSAEFEPGDYYLKVATVNGADGTHEPAVSFTGEGGGSQKQGPAFTAVNPPAGKEGEAYLYTFKATPKYNGAITWNVSSGSLPEGLKLDTGTGVLSGVPAKGGTYSFTIKATEEGGAYSTVNKSISIASVPTYTVRFNLNGGKAADGADYSYKTVKEGGTVTLPDAPSKSGYRFVYWNCNGTSYLPCSQLPVTDNAVYTAEYTLREPMKVNLPKSLDQAVGNLWMIGIDATGYAYSLWYDYNPETLCVEVPASNLRGKTFTRLEFRGLVDGVATVLAEYDGTVTEDTGTVTLKASDVKWQTLRGVEVTGVPETAYRYGDFCVQKADGAIRYYHPPFMTAEKTFSVHLTANGNDEAAARYDLNGDYVSSTVKEGKLVLEPLKLSDSAAVTVSVKLDGIDYYGTVIASQTVGGVTRTVYGRTSSWNRAESFTLHLYPGVEARFGLDNWGSGTYLFEGGTLASPKDGATHTIKARTLRLDTRIAMQTNADPAVALRYIRGVSNRKSISVTSKGKTTDAFYTAYWQSIQPDLTVRTDVCLKNISGDAAVTATYSSDYTFIASADAQLKEGEGTVNITAKLKPGVVVRLSSETTSSCFLAWFDSAGKYLDCDGTFYVNKWDRDRASICPAEKAGSYTVALLPHNYHSKDFLTGKTLSDLSDQIIASWPVTLTANGVEELAAYRISALESENAAFVTKPYSTLQASRESFSAASDVLCFSGSIGLDPGLTNGKLTALTIETKNDTSTSGNHVSAYVSSVVIGGVSYPLSQWDIIDGRYYLAIADPVELPCEYSIYATPGSASLDVKVAVEATVSFSPSAFQYYPNQKVGEATVSRPGASISTFSTYVCADTILVTGTANAKDTVKIYDNGELVADAVPERGDSNGYGGYSLRTGEWTAFVPLYGTDDTYTTVHEIHAETSSGVISDPITVIHRKNGPQLLALNLLSNKEEITGTYIYASYMKWSNSLKFKLLFANPDQLEPMSEWDNAMAVVKVYMGSGDIIFLPALPQDDGSFIADVGPLYGGYIDGVEAIYRPKTGPEDVSQNKDGSLNLIATTNEAKEFADALADMRELFTTDKNGKLVYAGITEAQSFSVSFDENNKAAVSGGLTETVGAKGVTEMEKAFSAAGKASDGYGLHYKELSSGTGVGDNILQWLNEIGKEKAADNKEKGANARLSYDYRSQIFSSKESFDNTKTRLARYATDAKYSANAAGSNHARYIYGTNTAADIYTITDCQYDDEGNYLSGSYRITASLLADTAATPAIYTASVTVELGPNFEGYAGLKAQGGVKKAPDFLSLFTVQAHASEVDTSGLYQTFDGKYSDDPAYAQSAKTESFLGDLANHSGAASGFITNSTSVLKGGWQKLGNGLGFVNLASSIGHLKKTWDNADYRIGQEVRMRMDLESLISSTCYKRLTVSKRQLVDEAFQKFKKAEKNYDTWDGWSTGLNLGLDVGSVICDAFSSTPGGEEFGAVGFALTGLSYVNGATLGKSANKAYQKMIDQYEESYRNIKGIFQSHAKQTGLDDCKKLKKDDSNSKTYSVNHDPSGIVYEGVIENPVENATVTLWYGVDANGQLVLEKDAKNVKQVIPAAQVWKTPMETVQVTGADGKYAWFVPQGLWYVTAEYAGMTGNSNADKAATVKVSGVKADGRAVTNLLPVLPEQLDVNIPLVDKTAPVVESVRFTDEGIYVTFSKYMVDTVKGADSVLDAANYTLKTASGSAGVASVKPVDQGHTPSNIDGNKTKTYTRTVLIIPKTALKAGEQALLTVKKAVKSYAGTAMAADFADSGTVATQKALGAPVIAGGARQTVAYGSGVTITLPKGAPEETVVYYTTDGSDPTKDGKLYENPFSVTNKMTVKAVAVCLGYKDSAVVTADFDVSEALQYMPAGHVLTDGGDPAGLTVTLSGDGYKGSVNVNTDGSYVFHDVPVGSYTLSFAGNDEFRAASVTVTVTTFDPWTDLTLTDVNTTPAYMPGDVDGDGIISSGDARLALRRSVMLEDYPEGSAAYLACDVDFDGGVSSADARLILRASVGLEDASKWHK